MNTATEPAEFETYAKAPDGAGGSLPTVVSTLRTLVRVKPLKGGRTLEAAQLDLRPGFEMVLKARADFEPGVGTTVLFRGARYTIQTRQWVDMTRREWLLTVLAQPAQTNG